MVEPPTNMAKSVKDRLLNIARKEGRAFDVLLVRFALERLLYRLSVSAHRDRFVLKGGMLVTIWVADDNRVTRDADFLGYGDSDPDRLVDDFREIMAIESDDGLAFDIDALAATVIREAMEYGGIRLKTAAHLERTRIPVTIDIGFGDVYPILPRWGDRQSHAVLPDGMHRNAKGIDVVVGRIAPRVAAGLKR